jgi:2-phospho-L-lactate guanylyltransferase
VSLPLVILPIKSFDDAKQRLREVLEPIPRRSLVEAMFSDVLVAIGRSSLKDRLLVVSGDNNAQRIASGYGATVMADEQRGHNAAAALGVRRAAELGAERVLLVPGDCPLLDPAELDALCERPAAARSLLIVPDRHGTGTNALLISPPDAFEPSFGPDSRGRHEEHALKDGLPAETVPISSLSLDVDTPDDLRAVQQVLGTQHGGAAHTRGLLAQLARTGQLQ